MAMKGRRVIDFIELWSIAGSGGLEIWVSVISFWKSNICWPQQPPRERYQIPVKNWNFDDPFHKKGLVLVIWVPGMIQPSGSVFLYWWIEAVEVIEATEVIEAVEVIEPIEVLRSGKSLLRSKESPGSWIQLYFDVLKRKCFLFESLL